MRLKKPWTKPEIRRVHVSDTYNPDDGLSRTQWDAARDLQRRAKKGASQESNGHAEALH